MWNTYCFEKSKNEYTRQFKTANVVKSNVASLCLVETIFYSDSVNLVVGKLSNYICEYLCDNFDVLTDLKGKQLISTVIDALTLYVKNLSTELKLNPEDLGISFSFISIKGKEYILGHLGDGNIAYSNKEKLSMMLENEFLLDVSCLFPMKSSVDFLVIEKGLVEDSKYFVLFSKKAFMCMEEYGNDFYEPVIEIASKVSAIVLNENDIDACINDHITNKTHSDYCLCFASLKEVNSKYYTLNDQQKMCYFKFSSQDPTSINRVKVLDMILYILEEPKSLNELANITKVKAQFLQDHLDCLESNNLIQCLNGNYKKIH